ncbi:hypothetical protein AAFC00_000037 [Neodothiora populina]|uniref:Uncharacterized protein n=1 Tax=Neodothiora populina TaxID=2781224 RepID=A0ABR3P2J4_9PEZI
MSNGSGSGPLQPTWTGFVQNSMDGLMLFEACLSGKLHHVPRRPHDRERANLIKSGSVFIYEENASGIKRWTDGVAWSPSRILGNFLIYRELEKPFPPGEKKRAMKRKRSQDLDGGRGSEENETAEYAALPPTPPSPTNPSLDQKADSAGVHDNDKEMERQLIGSLVDSYGFRPNGLVKKTMSISLNGVSHHLVSYYTVEDVKQRRLNRPLTDSRLAGLTVRPELFMKQNFRAPVEETEHYAVDSVGHAYPHMVYSPMVAGHYAIRPGNYGSSGYPMYGMATSSPMYGGLPATAWPSNPQPPASAAYSSPSYPTSGYDYYNRHPSNASQSTGSVKQEDSTPGHNYMSYSSQYPASTRSANPQGAYPPMQSQPYQSPIRASDNAYATSQTGSSTPSQPPANHPNGSAQHAYHTTPATSHQPQSHYQGYSLPHQTGSPHSSLKSPAPGSNQPLTSLPPRSALPASMGGYQGSYASQGGPPATGLGLSSGYGSSAPSGAHGTYANATYGSSAYGTASHNFRPTTEGEAGVSASGYT